VKELHLGHASLVVARSERALARLRPLPRAFYARDPLAVARELLGKLLVRRIASAEFAAGPGLPATGKSGKGEPNDLLLAGRIVEAEAYLGLTDPGAHAYRGPTARNAVLFGPPGHAYVYFIYGNHYCMNVSCQRVGEPGGGVLLRALEPVSGLETMAALRGLPLSSPPSLAELRRLTSGPGRLSQALDITRPRHNGCDLCSRAGGLYITAGLEPASSISALQISATPRINVSRAPHEEYRFVLTGNPFVSAKRA
jgi:DNA-3-methyladenine glycosylase